MSVAGVVLYKKLRVILSNTDSVLLIERKMPYALVPPTQLNVTEKDREDVQRFRLNQWFWDQYDLPHGRLEKELSDSQQETLFDMGMSTKEVEWCQVPYYNQLIKACEREIREETGLLSNLTPCMNTPILIAPFVGTDNVQYVQYLLTFTIDEEIFKKSSEYKILWTHYPELYMQGRTLCPEKLFYILKLLKKN